MLCLISVHTAMETVFKSLLWLPSDGSSQEITVVAADAGGWTHRNVSHVSRQEGNLTQSPVNGTWLPPADHFDPLGGHTVLQVNGSSSWVHSHTGNFEHASSDAVFFLLFRSSSSSSWRGRCPSSLWLETSWFCCRSRSTRRWKQSTTTTCWAWPLPTWPSERCPWTCTPPTSSWTSGRWGRWCVTCG